MYIYLKKNNNYITHVYVKLTKLYHNIKTKTGQLYL